jgi:hypothetical protein
MITQVFKAIVKHLRPVQVRKFVSENYVKGENVRTFATPETIQLACFPITEKDLKFAPEGVYTIEDRKFYEIGSGTIPAKSEIIFNNERYEIKSFSDRSFDGNFTKYMAKKITDDTENNS